MLALTPAATAAVSALLENSELPDSAGLRLQPGLDADGHNAIGITIALEPTAGDDLVSAGDGNDLFLAPGVAELLDDQVLDAEIEEEDVAFIIRPQAIDGHSPSM